MRCVKGAVIGLDHRPGPTQRKCGQAHDLEVQQGFDLFWMYAPLQSVKRCDMLPLASGKELRTLPEICSQGITRSWLMDLVFLIKSNPLKKIYRNALPDDILV